MGTRTHNFKIEERRRRVATSLTQSRTEEEIARELNVDQSTVSRDITTLKEMSQQFTYDLAKSDLAHCYKQCINGIEETKRQVWDMIRTGMLTPKDKLLALRLVKECNESQFSLFKDEPSMLNMKKLEERVEEIIGSKQQVIQG
jgi:IS30 family transposase